MRIFSWNIRKVRFKENIETLITGCNMAKAAKYEKIDFIKSKKHFNQSIKVELKKN